MKLLGLLLLAHAFLGQTIPIPTTNVAGGSPPSYTGPGDIQTTGAIAWWGLRAYSAAQAGTKAINVCNVGDAACADLSTNASGNLVVTTIGGSDCSIVICTIRVFYDQTGLTNCNSAACDLVAGIIAQRPVFTPNCFGSLPCATFAGFQFGETGNIITITVNQPFTISGVQERTGTFTSFADVTASPDTGSAAQFGFTNSANSFFLYAGSVVSVSGIADGSPHAIQGLFNGASGQIYADGTGTTVNPGTGTPTGAAMVLGGAPNALTGIIAEIGWWTGDQSTHFSAMNSNQHTYWGF